MVYFINASTKISGDPRGDSWVERGDISFTTSSLRVLLKRQDKVTDQK